MNTPAVKRSELTEAHIESYRTVKAELDTIACQHCRINALAQLAIHCGVAVLYCADDGEQSVEFFYGDGAHVQLSKEEATVWLANCQTLQEFWEKEKGCVALMELLLAAFMRMQIEQVIGDPDAPFLI